MSFVVIRDDKMYKKVFISHSKDDPNLEFFHKVFSGVGTEAMWMEFEEIVPPPYAYIMNKLNQCDAVFVLLSDYLLSKPETHNWVSFEIGLAANYQIQSIFPGLRQKGLDVFVFEPISRSIDFAVPYCTYYMPYVGDTEDIKFLKDLIKNTPFHQKGITVQCPNNNCRLEFKLLTDVKEFVCPSCRRGIYFTMPEVIY